MIGRLLVCWALCCGLSGCGAAAGAAAGGQVRGQFDAGRWLSPSAQRARAAGAGPLHAVAAVVAAEGDRAGGFIAVPSESCVLGLARSSKSIRDVDLFLFSDGGDVLASDEAPARNASVLLCPPHPDRVYLAARVMDGRGVLALGVQLVPSESAKKVAKALGMPAAQDNGALGIWPGLQAKIRQHRNELGGSWEDVRRAVLPVGPREVSVLSVPLEARRCLDVLATAGPAVLYFDLWAVDSAGRVVARASTQGRDRSLVLCSEHDSSVTLMLAPRISTGLVAVVAGRSGVGVAEQLAGHSWVYGASSLLPLAAALAKHHERIDELDWGQPRRVGAGRAVVGTSGSMPITLAEGCSRIDVVGGRPAGPLAAELWSNAGTRLAAGRGTECATLFYCGPRAVGWVEVRAELRPGPFEVEVRHAPSPIRGLGTAAARLLSWLEEVYGPTPLRRIDHAEAIEFKPGERVQVDYAVPVGRCVRVLAALEGSAAGLGLELVDPSGALVGSDRGRTTASLRWCAQNSPLRGTLRLEHQPGNTKGLLLRWVEGAE